MAHPVLAPILPKLERLVPRLGSDSDGEVIATVRAIGRTLAGSNLDWHDLAAALKAPDRREPPAGLRDLLAVAVWCRDRAAHLNGREANFVATVARQLAAGRPISPKQRAWLATIYDALREGGE